MSVWKFMFLCPVVYGFLPPLRKQSFSSWRSLNVALDKNRCYQETPLHFLSLEDLVFFYGDRQHWWGDFGHRDTRALYHQLLPVYYPSYVPHYDIQTLALKSFETRQCVKQYARRRSHFYVRLFSTVMDTSRNLWHYRRWRPIGATYEELWQKYQKQLEEQHPSLLPPDVQKQVAAKIVYKSCCTNAWMDDLCSE